MAGIAAAVASAREGAKTLLIERYGFLGGMGTAGLVNPFMQYSTTTGVPLVAGVFEELCDRMRKADGMLERSFDPEVMKFEAQEMVLESGVDLLLHAWVSGVRMDGDKLVGIDVLTKSGTINIDADAFVDSTGDADIAAMAGVPFEFGDGITGMSQAMTLMFTIGGVDATKMLAKVKSNPDDMSFPKLASDADTDDMAKYAYSVAGFYSEVEAARSNGDFPLEQDLVFFISMTRPGEVVVNTTHVGGLDATDCDELTQAEIISRRQAVAVMKFLKNYVPGFEKAYILQTATQIGIRETRRIKGEYTFSADDVTAAAKFPDSVLRSAYPIDVHKPVGKGYDRKEYNEPPKQPQDGDWYEIPYRCLVPLKVENLLVAGRSLSASHEGQAAVRIMPNCAALGEAAGVAAALASRDGITPRKLDGLALKAKLLEKGAIV